MATVIERNKQTKGGAKGLKLIARIVKQHPDATLRPIGPQYEKITSTTIGISIVFRALDKMLSGSLTSKIFIRYLRRHLLLRLHPGQKLAIDSSDVHKTAACRKPSRILARNSSPCRPIRLSITPSNLPAPDQGGATKDRNAPV